MTQSPSKAGFSRNAGRDKDKERSVDNISLFNVSCQKIGAFFHKKARKLNKL